MGVCAQAGSRPGVWPPGGPPGREGRRAGRPAACRLALTTGPAAGRSWLEGLTPTPHCAAQGLFSWWQSHQGTALGTRACASCLLRGAPCLPDTGKVARTWSRGREAVRSQAAGWPGRPWGERGSPREGSCREAAPDVTIPVARGPGDSPASQEVCPLRWPQGYRDLKC